MFYEIAQQGSPTKYELARLRSFEWTGRRNNILLQTLDLGTDIAFMLVLFDQAGAINLPESWTLYSATVGSDCPSAPQLSPSQLSTVLNLAIASAVVIAVSCSYRLIRAIQQIWRGRGDIEDWSDWVYVLTGALISIVDPWNGALFINELTVSSRLDRTDYDLAVNEFISDLTLMALEDIPQLTIQIIYGILTGQGDHTTVAWFVTIFSTTLHLATQVHETVHLGFQLPTLKRLHEEQDASGR